MPDLSLTFDPARLFPHLTGHHARLGIGYRAHGPYEPRAGHRFNPNKLLLDPYARELHGELMWSDALFGYRVGSNRGDLTFDRRDSARAISGAM